MAKKKVTKKKVTRKSRVGRPRLGLGPMMSVRLLKADYWRVKGMARHNNIRVANIIRLIIPAFFAYCDSTHNDLKKRRPADNER